MIINTLKLLTLSLLTLATAQSASLNTTRPLASSSSLSFSFVPSPTFPANASLSASSSPSPSSASTLSTPVPTSTALNSTSTNSTQPHLDTRVDPTFGILGSVLLLSGIPLTVQGSRNRWTTYAITGTYVGALVVSFVILRVGVLEQFQANGSLPSSSTRGLFLFASVIAGFFVGGCAVVWHVYCQHLVAAFAGFALGLWVLALHSDGLFAHSQLGYRYILVGGLAVIGFVLSTVPRLTTLSCLVGTAIVGATATVIGIDCLTTQGLKEFYLINIGFVALFPKLEGHYPITLGIQVELACIPAIAAIGTAVQMKFYKVLLRKARDLRAADRQRDDEEKAQGRNSSQRIAKEMEEWEAQHGRNSGMGTVSSMPELKRIGTESTLLGSGQLDYLPKVGDLSRTASNPTVQAAPQPPGEFQKYLERRQVLVSQPKSNNATAATAASESKRRSQVLSLPPPAHLPTPAPTSATRTTPENSTPSNSSSDDVPLGVALTRAATSQGLSQPRPRPISTLSTSSNTKPVRPRPTSLAYPSQSDPAVYQASSTRRLGEIGRRSTLLDLTEDDENTPLSNVKQRRSSSYHQMPQTPERIVVHNWANGGAVKPKQPAGPPIVGPRIMELDDLEAKHRKSLAQIQTKAKDEQEKKEQKEKWERKLAREAEEQRVKEENRRQATEKLRKTEAKRQSVGSINTLLRFAGAAAEQPAASPQRTVNRSAPGFEGAPRRQSAHPGQTQARMEPGRRASMGNLLDQQQQYRAPMAEFGAGPVTTSQSAYARPEFDRSRSAQQTRRESRSMSAFDNLNYQQQQYSAPIAPSGMWTMSGEGLPPGAAMPVASTRR